MTDQDIIRLGDYCEDLLKQDGFQALVEHFNKAAAVHFLETSPGDTARREEVYATYNGLKAFLETMNSFMAERDNLNAPSSDDDDAQYDD